MTVGRIEWSIDDIAGHLRTSSVFLHLDAAAIDRLARCAEVTLVEAGHTITEEGSVGDDAFIVIAGRLEVTTASSDGSPRIVNHLGPGDVVGEMALITDEPRSATVRARRDAAMLRIGSEDFRSIVLDHPDALLDVTRTVMARLNSSIHGVRPAEVRKVIAVLSAGGRQAHVEFAQLLAQHLETDRVALVTAESLRVAVGDEASDAATAEYLHVVEDRNDYVVMVGGTGTDAWTRMCRRQSDVTLLVGYADSLRNLGDDETLHGEVVGSPVELVLVHEGSAPRGTAAILNRRDVRRHHHVRNGSSHDIARVSRIIRGVSTGVVFGGGGARGFAHLGVVKAMNAAGVAIDHVGGTSIGASLAAGVGMGLDWDRMVELARWVTFERGSIIDTTMPLVSIAAGRRLTSGMREGFGDAEIEDLWTEFFCVSTDLTDGDIHVHTHGPVWSAVRASISIPGLYPPMRSAEGHVLVDGGVLDNVPTSVMRDRFAPATLIAVDLTAKSTLRSSDLDESGSMSGWRVARHRVLPWKDRLDVPGLVETLIASSTISGGATAEDADIVIRPPVDEFGFMDFAACDELIEAGYRYASELFERQGRRA